MTELSGFREVDHTADWELEVWAPDLTALLEQAARGMFTLSRTTLQPGPRTTHPLSIEAADDESLLVGFLSELLYLSEMAGLGFDTYHLRLEDGRLVSDLEGAPLAAMDKEIKAVTYHNLHVRRETGGLRVNIVFDV